MAQENPLNFDMNALLTTWGKMTNDSWGDMGKTFTAFSQPKDEAGGGQHTSRSQDTVESILKTWRMVSSAMNSPESLNANLSGMGDLPGILVKLAQISVDGITRFQNKAWDNLNRVADHRKLFDFDGFDAGFFDDWKAMYEQEIRKYLQIPQLGLTRFYQERFSLAVDKHQLLQSTLGEFIYVLFKPIENSMKALQDLMVEPQEGTDIPTSTKEAYQRWIVILEADYAQLLKSPEYLKVLNKLLKAMTDFSTIKDEIVQDMASSLPFPGRKEMDELYKEMYRLRKRVRELEKKNEHL